MLEKGHVVEQGTHLELLGKNGAYAKLIKNQLPSLGADDKKGPQQLYNNTGDKGQQGVALQEETIKIDSQKSKIETINKIGSKNEGKEIKVFSRLMSYVSGSHKLFLIFGCFFSIITGALMPMFALFLADMIEVFAKYHVLKQGTVVDYTSSFLDSEVTRISLSFVVMAVIALISNFFKLHIFNLVGSTLTFDLRKDLLSKLLKKTMLFFDKQNYNAGILSSRLGADCLVVNSIVGSSIGAIIEGIGSLACGITIAFLSSWRLAIIGLFGCPLIIVAGVIQSKMMMQGDQKTKGENGGEEE